MTKLKPIIKLRDNDPDLGTLICLFVDDSEERIFGCIAKKHYRGDDAGRYPKSNADEVNNNPDKNLDRVELASRYPNGKKIGSLQIMPNGSGLYIDNSRDSGADRVSNYEVVKRAKPQENPQ